MQSAGLRASKRQALDGPETPTGADQLQRGLQASAVLLALPSELERCILSLLHSADLASLACTCGALRESAEDCGLWRLEWERVYGEAGALQEAAAARAGGWKRLFASRHAALKEADPWLKPSVFEVEASVHALVALPAAPADGGPADSAPPAASAHAAAPAAATAVQQGQAQEGEQAEQEGEIQAAPVEEGEEPELCLVFLVDGSGSVTEEDFRVMTDFMTGAVRELAGAPHGPRSRVAVVQFSNDVRVEQGPVAVDVAQFETLMGNMHRMNGGTNIALAVQKAGQLLKPLGPRTHRVLALLTDGRIDSHQSREAADMAARLGDEQACVRLHAYGVGRGVDREELLRIIGGREPQTAEQRYLGLMVLDEAPW